VRAGCGLVLIRPFAGELSPLTRRSETENGELEEPVQPGRTESCAWRRVVDHYITRAIGRGFPFPRFFRTSSTRAEPGASVLIQTDSGTPILAVRPFGKRPRGCLRVPNIRA